MKGLQIFSALRVLFTKQKKSECGHSLKEKENKQDEPKASEKITVIYDFTTPLIEETKTRELYQHLTNSSS